MNKNLFLLAGTLSFLLIAWSIFYYLVIFLPNIENLKIEQTNERIKKNEESLDNCLKDANEKKREHIKLNWTETKDGNIRTTDDVLKMAESIKENSIDSCYKRYPLK